MRKRIRGEKEGCIGKKAIALERKFFHKEKFFMKKNFSWRKVFHEEKFVMKKSFSWKKVFHEEKFFKKKNFSWRKIFHEVKFFMKQFFMKQWHWKESSNSISIKLLWFFSWATAQFTGRWVTNMHFIYYSASEFVKRTTTEQSKCVFDHLNFWMHDLDRQSAKKP